MLTFSGSSCVLHISLYSAPFKRQHTKDMPLSWCSQALCWLEPALTSENQKGLDENPKPGESQECVRKTLWTFTTQTFPNFPSSGGSPEQCDWEKSKTKQKIATGQYSFKRSLCKFKKKQSKNEFAMGFSTPSPTLNTNSHCLCRCLECTEHIYAMLEAVMGLDTNKMEARDIIRNVITGFIRVT